jgi:MFS family permease
MQTMSGEAKGYAEFRKGWPVVLSALLGIGLGLSPLPFYTIGLLAPELSRAFGWSFAQILIAVPITTVGAIFGGPLVGLLVDRVGVRIVTLASVPLFGLAFMGFALSDGSLTLYYINWALVAMVGAGTLPITWTRAVNNWFDVRKGLALGLCLMGTGIFGYLVKPFTAWVIDLDGWRAAYVALGALPIFISWPVAFLCFHDVAEARGTRAERNRFEADRQAMTPGLTLREALKTWRFWLLAGALLPISFAVGGPIPNVENILKLSGFARPDIVTIASLIGLSVVVGRTVGGWLLDRLWAPGVALVLLSGPIAAYWVLSGGSFSYNTAALSIFLMGFGAGVEYDLIAFIVARYFGMKNYSAVYGALYSFFAAGAGTGPVVFGRYFDVTHSYATPLALASGLMLLGSLMLLALGKYRKFDEPKVAEHAQGAPLAGEAVSG